MYIKKHKTLEAALNHLAKLIKKENLRFNIGLNESNEFILEYYFYTEIQKKRFTQVQKINIGDEVVYRPIFENKAKKFTITDINIKEGFIFLDNKKYLIKFSCGILKNNTEVFKSVDTVQFNYSLKDIKESDFVEYLNIKKIKFQRHQAMSGSMYWLINNISFRKSNHFNPNNTNNDKIEVSSFFQILISVFC